MKTISKRGGFRNENRISKLNALLRLRMAILDERYELCDEFIEQARVLGARPQEIKKVLTNPRTYEFEGV